MHSGLVLVEMKLCVLLLALLLSVGCSGERPSLLITSHADTGQRL